jgi:hypothetical protein
MHDSFFSVNKSDSSKPKRMTLKAFRPTANFPGEAREAIEARMKQERYDSFSEYMLALVLFDIYCNRPHLFTGPLMREPAYIREAVIMELLNDFKAGATEQKKPGGWFERRIQELVEQAKLKGK